MGTINKRNVGSVGCMGFVVTCIPSDSYFLEVVSAIPYYRLWLAATVRMQ